VLNRWGGLGAHRNAVSFSGDANQHREVLRWELWATPRAANALSAYWSHDVGGFMCNHINQSECSGDPAMDSNGLLYLRWLQAAVTFPVFRTHASTWNLAVMERRIWKFPSMFPAMADAMRLRSALVPYTYSEAARTARSGLAYVRALYFEWPLEEDAYAPLESPVGQQYLFGDALLASPIWATNETAAGPGGGAPAPTRRRSAAPAGFAGRPRRAPRRPMSSNETVARTPSRAERLSTAIATFWSIR
jgi:alpha-glucosidase (family GH31 glycosyl hydrolase)